MSYVTCHLYISCGFPLSDDLTIIKAISQQSPAVHPGMNRECTALVWQQVQYMSFCNVILTSQSDRDIHNVGPPGADDITFAIHVHGNSQNRYVQLNYSSLNSSFRYLSFNSD